MRSTHQTSLLSEQDIFGELATARERVDELLIDVRSFTVLAHSRPWVALDDLLAELRAAATTVAVLERLMDQAR